MDEFSYGIGPRPGWRVSGALIPPTCRQHCYQAPPPATPPPAAIAAGDARDSPAPAGTVTAIETAAGAGLVSVSVTGADRAGWSRVSCWHWQGFTTARTFGSRNGYVYT